MYIFPKKCVLSDGENNHDSYQMCRLTYNVGLSEAK